MCAAAAASLTETPPKNPQPPEDLESKILAAKASELAQAFTTEQLVLLTALYTAQKTGAPLPFTATEIESLEASLRDAATRVQAAAASVRNQHAMDLAAAKQAEEKSRIDALRQAVGDCSLAETQAYLDTLGGTQNSHTSPPPALVTYGRITKRFSYFIAHQGDPNHPQLQISSGGLQEVFPDWDPKECTAFMQSIERYTPKLWTECFQILLDCCKAQARPLPKPLPKTPLECLQASFLQKPLSPPILESLFWESLFSQRFYLAFVCMEVLKKNVLEIKCSLSSLQILRRINFTIETTKNIICKFILDSIKITEKPQEPFITKNPRNIQNFMDNSLLPKDKTILQFLDHIITQSEIPRINKFPRDQSFLAEIIHPDRDWKE